MMYKILCPLILLFLINCKGRQDHILIGLAKTLKTEELNGKFVIITYHACTSCLIAAEEYMLAALNSKNNKIKFILTGFATVKEMKIKYKEFLGNENLFLDQENNFYRAREDLRYPIYLEIENGDLINLIDLNLENKPSLVLPLP